MSQQCPSYTCELPTDYITSDTCIYYNPSLAIPTYYASPCYDLNNNYCPPTYLSNSTCTTPPHIIDLKYPGEKCHTDEDCGPYSTGCSNQVCQGLKQGSICKSHSYCMPGLRCDQTCKAQLEIGSNGCKSDFDCVNNAGCDKNNNEDTGTCIEYWTLDNSQAVGQCLNYSNWLCKSSTCLGSQCVEAASSSKLPTGCYKDSDCVSSNSQITSQCICGKNRNANMYCGLFYGDLYYVEYFNIARHWLASKLFVKCNTERRLSYVCVGDWWDRKQSYLMNYYYYYSSWYPVVYEYEDCIGEIYLAGFLNVKSLLKNILQIEAYSEYWFVWLSVYFL